MLSRTPSHKSLCYFSQRRVALGAYGRTIAAGSALMHLAACASESPRDPVAVDCRSVDENYDLSPWQPFDTAATPQWFGVSDFTPGAMVGVNTAGPDAQEVRHDPVVEAIEDVPELGAQEEGRCGNGFALVLRADKFSDWGAFFAEYASAQNPMSDGIDDASGELYDGFSFWARSAPGSDRYFTFAVENWDTSGFGIDGEPPDPFATDCVARTSEEVSPGVYEETNEFPAGTDPKDTCGNPFRKIIETSDVWRFYTIPWADFYQDAHPNRELGGLNPEQRILRLRINFISGTRNEVWIDDIGLYRELPR